MALITTTAQNAAVQVSITRAGTICATKLNKNTLMTTVKRPSVIQIRGREIIFTTGFTKKLMSPSTAPARISHFQLPRKWMPCTRRAAAQMPMALERMWMISRSICVSQILTGKIIRVKFLTFPCLNPIITLDLAIIKLE